MICSYGCNQEAKFRLKNGKWCCSETSNSCIEVKRKNSEGLKRLYSEGKKTSTWKIDERCREKSNESRIANLKKKPFEEWGRILKEELILKEQEFKCLLCKIEQIWNNLPLKFQLDHINGDNKNNKRENLRLICPNCHSQTPTWCGRGGNGGKVKK